MLGCTEGRCRVGAGLRAGCHAVPRQRCQLAEAPSTDTAQPAAALPDFVVLAQPPRPARLPGGLRLPQPAALHPGRPAARRRQRMGGSGQGLRAVPQLQLRLHRRECGSGPWGGGRRDGGVTPPGVPAAPRTAPAPQVPMLRRCLTRLRATPAGRALLLEHCVALHQLVGSAVLALAVLHAGAHVANYGERGGRASVSRGAAAGPGGRWGWGCSRRALPATPLWWLSRAGGAAAGPADVSHPLLPSPRQERGRLGFPWPSRGVFAQGQMFHFQYARANPGCAFTHSHSLRPHSPLLCLQAGWHRMGTVPSPSSCWWRVPVAGGSVAQPHRPGWPCSCCCLQCSPSPAPASAVVGTLRYVNAHRHARGAPSRSTGGTEPCTAHPF